MQVLDQGARLANAIEADKIAKALRQNPIPTLLEELTFDANGDLIDPQIWIYQVSDGEFQQVDW